MATLVLSAVGATLGASVGGGVLGLSSVVIGRAVGATIGQVIDRRVIGQRLMGSGSEVVDHGRIDRFRLNRASEGARIEETYGRMRVSGQVIWSSRFLETVNVQQVQSGSGKGGGGPTTTVRDYSYSVSLAIALGEGEIARVGRIWADGNEIAPKDLNLRLYPGSETQLPDAKIEAVEGSGRAPAFRGTAYVVIEDLELEAFGNRVPQFNFEIVRATPGASGVEPELADLIRAVALVPGTGEYALATSPVYLSGLPGQERPANVNTPLGVPDLVASLDTLKSELPKHRATSLVVSWFGGDLRCGSCEIAPKVEQSDADGLSMKWRVSGLTRATAAVMPLLEGRPVYGGTPADAAVVEALQALRAGGREAMFYPFVLMDQLSRNGLRDPWTGAEDQPALPWRGQITLSVAPGRAGSPDRTAAAEAEVAAFFGSAGPDDFSVAGTTVTYTGPSEFSYRRFILHYAHLCAAAGGIDAFCIGSELRGLTQIRGEGGGFPVVDVLRQLAADVRAILGPTVRIGYAADWSEYFGYQPQDGSGDVFFHLDPLWSDDEIDFVGIDNYMPLSDWRDGETHADISAGSLYDIGYLRGNIEGGEGFDWYYNSTEASEAQRRLPIEDGAYGEDWVFRYKDLRNWWGSEHHDRPGGIRAAQPTSWVPRSKPIWFTELGCPSVDKGANAPNRFYDPKSDESALPPYSNGQRDDLMQMQFLRAHLGYWSNSEINPVSPVYRGPMVDTSHVFVWAWDARPFPFFPNAIDVWTDGGNYGRGHWLNGRTSSRSLASVVAEICLASGVSDFDVTGLYGVVRGFAPGEAETGRGALQALMLAHGFDPVEREGRLVFRTRRSRIDGRIAAHDLALNAEAEGDVERIRASSAETAGRVRLNAIESEGSYQISAREAAFPDDTVPTVTQTDLPLLLTQGETRSIAERWLCEMRVARDTVRFALPPSRTDLSAGDVFELDEPGGPARYRIDQIERSGIQIVEAQRIDLEAWSPSQTADDASVPPPVFIANAPVHAEFLDLPLLTGAEDPNAPHVAVFADPWPGGASVFRSTGTDGYRLNVVVPSRAVLGETGTNLGSARPGLIDRGPALRVRLYGGVLTSVSDGDLLNGANAAAIGTAGSDDWEIFQFRDAVLVGEDLWELSWRLRGQAGTDATMPDGWSAGSRFVLLDGAVRQIALASSERGVPRTYRTGPSRRLVDDPVYVEETRAFDGAGLRPYAPVHLRVVSDGAGGHEVSWVRRTRIDGDSWAGYEVPLGEDAERYLVRVVDGVTVRREVTVDLPAFVYSGADRVIDGITGGYAVDVAQISDRFGPGPFRRIVIDE